MQINEAFSGSQETVKTLVRANYLPMVNAERRHLWKTVLDKRMTEARGFPDASLVTKDTYEDTVQSCFGTEGKRPSYLVQISIGFALRLILPPPLKVFI